MWSCLLTLTCGMLETGVGGSAMPASAWQHASGPPTLEVKCKKLEGLLKAVGGAEGIFMNLFGSQGTQDTFWLDRFPLLLVVLTTTTLAANVKSDAVVRYQRSTAADPLA